MAITLDATGTATGADQGGGNHAFTGSITIGTLTNGILVVAINCYSGSGAVTGVRLDSSTGTPMTLIGANVAGPGSNQNMAFFYLLNPPSGAHTFYVEGGYAMGALVASSWSGVQQVAPVSIATQNNNGGTETLTGTTAANDVVIDGVGTNSGDGTSATPSAGQTQLATLVTGGVCNACSSYKVASGASTTMSWTGATTSFSAAEAIALVPASSGTTAAVAGTLRTGARLLGALTTIVALQGTVRADSARLTGAATTATALAGTVRAGPARLPGADPTFGVFAAPVMGPTARLRGTLTTGTPLAGTLRIAGPRVTGALTVAPAAMAGTIRVDTPRLKGALTSTVALAGTLRDIGPRATGQMTTVVAITGRADATGARITGTAVTLTTGGAATSYVGTLTGAARLTAAITTAARLTGTITTTPGSHT